MKKDNNKNILLLIISLLFFLSFVINLYLYLDKSELEDSLDEKALIDAQLTQWAENIDNSSEMFFEFNVFNYGDAEAKNIRATCKLYDEDGLKLLSAKTDYVGNLASKSYVLKEISTNNYPTNPDVYYIPYCYIESCDNCEILYKRIPELIQDYEE